MLAIGASVALKNELYLFLFRIHIPFSGNRNHSGNDTWVYNFPGRSQTWALAARTFGSEIRPVELVQHRSWTARGGIGITAL